MSIISPINKEEKYIIHLLPLGRYIATGIKNRLRSLPLPTHYTSSRSAPSDMGRAAVLPISFFA
jgi:hypothetical protein